MYVRRWAHVCVMRWLATFMCVIEIATSGTTQEEVPQTVHYNHL